MTSQDISGGVRRVVLLDDATLPAPVQHLADHAGLKLTVAQGRDALDPKGDIPVAVILRGPVFDIASRLAAGTLPKQVLDSWCRDCAADLARLEPMGQRAVVLDRGDLATAPQAGLACLVAAWGLDLPIDNDIRPADPMPAAITQVLARALIDTSGPARALTQRVHRLTGAPAELTPETALQASRDLAALGAEAMRARSEAVVARAGRLAAESQAATIRTEAEMRLAVLGAALLQAPDVE